MRNLRRSAPTSGCSSALTCRDAGTAGLPRGLAGECSVISVHGICSASRTSPGKGSRAASSWCNRVAAIRANNVEPTGHEDDPLHSDALWTVEFWMSRIDSDRTILEELGLNIR